MSRDVLTISTYAFPTVRIVCAKCARSGQYRPSSRMQAPATGGKPYFGRKHYYAEQGSIGGKILAVVIHSDNALLSKWKSHF
jgi:hypothetical protein